MDRTARRALREGVAEINDLRDAIEHADERLSMPGAGAALPVVFLQAEHVSVGDDSIAYVDLAQWIHQTFRLVRMLVDSPGDK